MMTAANLAITAVCVLLIVLAVCATGLTIAWWGYRAVVRASEVAPAATEAQIAAALSSGLRAGSHFGGRTPEERAVDSELARAGLRADELLKASRTPVGGTGDPPGPQLSRRSPPCSLCASFRAAWGRTRHRLGLN